MRFIVKYKSQGRIYTKAFNAHSQSALEQNLKNYMVLSITHRASFLESFQRRISTKDLLGAFYELKLGLKAQLPLQVLLENIQNHCKNKTLALRFQKALFALNSGKNLAQSFKEAGFSDFVCAMLLVGQKANLLQEVVDIVILRLKNQQKNQKILTKVMLYPSIVFFVMVCVFLGVTLFVLPQFEVLFSGIDTQLPFVSQSLLFMREVVLDYGVLSLALFGAFCIMLLSTYKKVESFKMRVDFLALKLPILGRVLYDFEMVQFLLSFFWLYRAGVSLKEALEIATKSLHNGYLQHKASGIFSVIAQGVEIKEALSVLFDGFGAQLLSGVHNEIGFLESLEVLLELYQEELKTHSEALLGAIEPLMILILGALVLWLALGIFLPLWELPLQMQNV
ncbi:type II secretion system F family protein [Helicobacter sp. MIT 11-5569]|uniref:type II secretion system F family protein n=1 Tax=Helicobacter sp. MIT 11-5569 TaxID=1548151 RepID=UPI00051FF06A|nr:type II secretion system F family protein [Helicobacter sp. MIT 11-5569]TLD82901.1 type II secretion system F family protein [Helicobacter sp. MIT 11-5569]